MEMPPVNSTYSSGAPQSMPGGPLGESTGLGDNLGGLPRDYPELRNLRAEDLGRGRRRIKLPVFLFIATCLSTFLAGATDWIPSNAFQWLSNPSLFRWMIVAHWQQGLIYTGAVLAILLTHEMGHFTATLIHRIPASLPYFIPCPIASFGTMGAVIGMAGHRADRRQVFDIGISGPIAGLVVAVPILVMGVYRLDFSHPGYGPIAFDLPWLVRLLMQYLRPDLPAVRSIAISQMNPYFMAAWVGMLITGLNMMPISQLDGGHVIYALFLRKGHWIARLFLLTAIVYIIVTGAMFWILMLVLVVMIGTDHPPTANDDIPLGWFRTVLGLVSLAIPLLCFPPRGFLM